MVAQTLSNLRRFVGHFPLIPVACALAPMCLSAQEADTRPDDAKVNIIPRAKPSDQVAIRSELEKRAATFVGHAGRSSVVVSAWPRRLMAQSRRSS